MFFLSRDRAFGVPKYHDHSNEIPPHIGTIPQVVLRASPPYVVTSSVSSFRDLPDLLSHGIEELLLSDLQLLASTLCALAACFSVGQRPNGDTFLPLIDNAYARDCQVFEVRAVGVV